MWVTCEEVTTGVALEQHYECSTSCPPRHDELCDLIQSFHENQEHIQRQAFDGAGSGPQTSAEGHYPECEDHPTPPIGKLSLDTHPGYEDDENYPQYDPPESDYTHEKIGEQELVPVGHTPDAKKDHRSRPRGGPESFHGPSASYGGQEAADSSQALVFDSSCPYDAGIEYMVHGQDAGPQHSPESVRNSGKESRRHHRSGKNTKTPNSAKKKEKRKE